MISETTSTVVGVVGRVMGDVVSFSIVLGTLANILPPLAALISILWIGFQFYHFEKARRATRKEKDGNT